MEERLPDVLAAYSNTLSSFVERAGPAVVSVRVRHERRSSRRGGRVRLRDCL